MSAVLSPAAIERDSEQAFLESQKLPPERRSFAGMTDLRVPACRHGEAAQHHCCPQHQCGHGGQYGARAPVERGQGERHATTGQHEDAGDPGG